jgi:hypothetical protein
MQGDYLNLLIEEDSNITWKSFIWNVPRGVVKFALNAGLNTLPSADNLKRWGKRTSDICKICNLGKQTLNHILSSCSISLEEGRYTWRHDSVLQTIYDFILPKLMDGFSMYCDLQGRGAGNSGNIPSDVIVTSQRPDIVLISPISKHIVIFELTCPWDTNVESNHEYKQNKYASLVTDLGKEWRNVNLFCVEVSVHGQLTKSNKARLKSFLLKTTGRRRVSCCDLIIRVSK